MGLRLYNTLTRSKEDFVPLDASDVRMYVCGPTVYDFAHIGNARPVIVFDVLYRLLRHLHGVNNVKYVRNITDVDDKIIERARADHPGMALNEAIAKVTTETEKQFHADVAALGCLPPDEEPHATAHIPQMIAMIERLIERGHAYAQDGHALFAVGSFDDYGRLARRSTEDMIAGARVEVAPYKRDAMDFVLWKPSAADEPGWDSPWSRGRPGWHIECSAMSAAHLGETFDIHGGGIDLVFPHHENEVAQSRCAHGSDIMARTWMHNGFLQVEGRKMSKSEGNFVTISDLLHTDKFGGHMWCGDAIRWAMLTTQYRQPIDWTADRLEEADDELDDFAGWIPLGVQPRPPSAEIVETLCDDINVPKAKAHLHKLLSSVRSNLDPDIAGQLLGDLDLLGIDLTARLSSHLAGELPSAIKLRLANTFGKSIDDVIAARNAARAAKDFAEADRIRGELAEMGVQLKDGPDGTTWEVAR